MKIKRAFLLSSFLALTIVLNSCTSDTEQSDSFLSKASLLSPLNYSDRVSLRPTLEWQGQISSDPSDLSFDIYLSKNPNPVVIIAQDIKKLSYTLEDNLDPLSTYYWKILSKISDKARVSKTFSFSTGPIVSVPPESISIEGDKSITIRKDFKKQLLTIIEPNNTTIKTVGWNSSDPSIASITNDGIITAIKPGRVIITVKTADGSLSDSVTVNVADNKINVASISIKDAIAGQVIDIEIGTTKTLAAEVYPRDATNQNFFWKGQDGKENIATVTSDGKIRGLAPGSIQVTVVAEDDQTKTNSITFRVIRTPPPDNSVLASGNIGSHKYYIIKTPRSWTDAASYAKSFGGHLVHITSSTEQLYIQGLIQQAVNNPNNISNAVISTNDAGGVGYFWIGATDKDSEGIWLWNGADGDPSIAPLIGSFDPSTGIWLSTNDSTYQYQNWGQESPGGNQVQPNNFGGNQNFGAIAISEFNNSSSSSGISQTYGLEYQWNDLESTANPFIIEVEDP